VSRHTRECIIREGTDNAVLDVKRLFFAVGRISLIFTISYSSRVAIEFTKISLKYLDKRSFLYKNVSNKRKDFLLVLVSHEKKTNNKTKKLLIIIIIITIIIIL